MSAIRVLLVDDEKLVRESMLRLLPWAKHGMQVVGEAGNGQAALDFLRQNSVDLIFLDLAMPVMDGFALMEVCEGEFPSLVKVVLTCHQEADYYRQSMRMGTVDYLCKTHFDFEQMEELLAFLAEKVSLQKKRKRLVCCAGEAVEWAKRLLDERHMPYHVHAGGLLYLHAEDLGDVPRLLSANPGITLVYYDEVDAQLLAAHPEWLGRYVDRVLFYESMGAARAHSLARWEIGAPMEAVDEARLAGMLAHGVWLVSSQETAALADRLAQSRFSGQALCAILRRLRDDLHFFLKSVEGYPDIMALAVTDFTSARRMMHLLSGAVAEKLGDPDESFSDQILLAVLQAMALVREHDAAHSDQETIARRVGVSRSYFSKCFGRVTGMSFSMFQRRERIAHANALLETTDMPLCDISQACGFEDERYFIRIYHDIMLCNPAQYRSARRGL